MANYYTVQSVDHPSSLLSGLYPDQIVQDPSASQVQATRLVDDAFIRICDMVNDSSMIVRAKVKPPYGTTEHHCRPLVPFILTIFTMVLDLGVLAFGAVQVR